MTVSLNGISSTNSQYKIHIKCLNLLPFPMAFCILARRTQALGKLWPSSGMCYRVVSSSGGNKLSHFLSLFLFLMILVLRGGRSWWIRPRTAEEFIGRIAEFMEGIRWQDNGVLEWRNKAHNTEFWMFQLVVLPKGTWKIISVRFGAVH